MARMQFTVLGNPISQSKSPELHQHFALQAGISIKYTKTKSTMEEFSDLVAMKLAKSLNGANVTSPFKELAFKVANEKSTRAKIARSANTLIFRPDNSIYADNTDGLGFIKDIQHNLRYLLMNKNILILGAGGAVRGILHPIIDARPSKITIANRTASKLESLQKDYNLHENLDIKSYSELERNYDLVIDGTSFNAWPLPLKTKVFDNCSLIYDLKYITNEETPIINIAKQLNIQCTDGFGMLVEQAAMSFYLWTGFFPNTQLLLKNN